MITLEEFSELLQVLYAAPLYQERWIHFLDLLCAHTRSHSGFLICADSRLGTAIHAQGGEMALSDAAMTAYAAELAPKDPYRLPMLRLGKTGLMDCEALVPTEKLLQTEMFQKIIAPAGLRYPTLMVLTCTLRRLEGVSFWRTAEEGPMDEESNRLLRLLVPHIQGALELRQVLGIAHRRIAGVEAMLNASEKPMFLLDERGRVLHWNQSAGVLLQRGDSLTMEKKQLVPAHPQMREPFRKFVQSIPLNESYAPGKAPSRPISLEKKPGGRPLQVLAAPVPRSHESPMQYLLLVVSDPDALTEHTDDALREYFGFTTAETEVANGLLTGYSIEEIAALRSVSVGTARVQLKSLFAKTRTSRQADLVKLLMTVPKIASA